MDEPDRRVIGARPAQTARYAAKARQELSVRSLTAVLIPTPGMLVRIGLKRVSKNPLFYLKSHLVFLLTQRDDLERQVWKNNDSSIRSGNNDTLFCQCLDDIYNKALSRLAAATGNAPMVAGWSMTSRI